MGRPGKLTPEIQTQIIDAIQLGASRDVAAQAAGISPRTFYAWDARGRDDNDNSHPNPDDFTMDQLKAIATSQGIDPKTAVPGRMTKKALAEQLTQTTEYLQFHQALKKATASSEIYLLTQAHVHAQRAGDWRFFMTALERRFPERWARLSRTEISLPGEGAGVDTEKALEAGRRIVKGLEILEGGKADTG